MSDINKLDVIVGRFISASDEARNAFIDELRAEIERLRAALDLEQRRLKVSEEALRRALEPKP